MAGLWGMKIAKTIRSKIKQAVKRSSFSFTINGTVFVPDKQSLNISEPKRSCATGQAYRDGVCGKIFNRYKNNSSRALLLEVLLLKRKYRIMV